MCIRDSEYTVAEYRAGVLSTEYTVAEYSMTGVHSGLSGQRVLRLQAAPCDSRPQLARLLSLHPLQPLQPLQIT